MIKFTLQFSNYVLISFVFTLFIELKFYLQQWKMEIIHVLHVTTTCTFKLSKIIYRQTIRCTLFYLHVFLLYLRPQILPIFRYKKNGLSLTEKPSSTTSSEKNRNCSIYF